MSPPLLSAELWQSLRLTLELAATSCVLLVAISLPLTCVLRMSTSRTAAFIEALVSLPIVLPPTVIGFYLLLALGSQSPIGQLSIRLLGHSLAFSFPGLVIGSIIYSLPFAVQPIHSALSEIDAALIEAAAALGASGRQIFWRMMVPAARGGILTGAALSFAHTMGEFGVVLMLGGNIPGVTRVASIALYDETQTLDYAAANRYALVLVLISFLMLISIAALRRLRVHAVKPRLR